jgi:hypothetical protein
MRLSLIVLSLLLPAVSVRAQTAVQQNGTTGAGVKLDAAERRRVIDAAATNLRMHYVDRPVGRKMADALLAQEKNGDDNAVSDGAAFADLLTRQMRDVSHDMHTVLVYSEEKLPSQPHPPSAADQARFREETERNHCFMEKPEILPHNIGYLKIIGFSDPSVCEATARAAMADLNRVDAIIFDVRDNRGGSGEMASLLVAYLFDHPEYMYDPREIPQPHSWTRSPVDGSAFGDKPVFVLTSGVTASAAEYFCYNLKMLRRATLVGETTSGYAHAGEWHRIDDHFGMGITEVKAINPYADADWEGVGVEPDVKVKASDALQTAQRLAESRLRPK